MISPKMQADNLRNIFYFRAPVAALIAKKESDASRYSYWDAVLKELGVLQIEKDFENLAIKIAANFNNVGYLDSDEYYSGDKRFRIIPKDELMDQTGKILTTAARINVQTCEIEINRPLVSETKHSFILFLLIWCYARWKALDQLNSMQDPDQWADMVAAEYVLMQYLLNKPKVDIFSVKTEITEGFLKMKHESNTEEMQNRYYELGSYLTQF